MRSVGKLQRQKPALFSATEASDLIDIGWPGLPSFDESHYKTYQGATQNQPPRHLGQLFLVPKFEARTEVSRYLSRILNNSLPHAKRQQAQLRKLCDLAKQQDLAPATAADDATRLRRAFDRNLVALYYKPRIAPVAPKVPVVPVVSAPVAPTKTWVAIRLVDEDGEPLADQAVEIELPDGSVQSLTTDADGKARVDDLSPNGACTVAFRDQVSLFDIAARF